MKRSVKSMVGATLLEVMLVLAIAAMIIVMSVRYYQTANAAEEANTALEQIQAIVSAADSLAQPFGSYSGAGVATTTVAAVLPASAMTTPWGGSITLGSVSPNQYTMSITSVPANICNLIVAKLTANNHFTSMTACSGTTNFSVTYQAAV